MSTLIGRCPCNLRNAAHAHTRNPLQQCFEDFPDLLYKDFFFMSVTRLKEGEVAAVAVNCRTSSLCSHALFTTRQTHSDEHDYWSCRLMHCSSAVSQQASRK